MLQRHDASLRFLLGAIPGADHHLVHLIRDEPDCQTGFGRNLIEIIERAYPTKPVLPRRTDSLDDPPIKTSPVLSHQRSAATAVIE